MFYLNYEECKVMRKNKAKELNNGFILTMRNVKN